MIFLKNVLITGVASGIGYALAKKYSENKFLVYGIDIVRTKPNIDNLNYYSCDITSETDLLNILNEFKNKDVVFDLIINVAGIHKMASLVETDYKKIKSVIDVNLLGTMLVNKTFHPLLNKKGRIVIITSEVASFDPLPFNSLYSISKIALDAYAQGLRQELNLLNQKVITIRPGAVETPLSNGSSIDTKNLADDTVLYKNEAKHFLSLVERFTGKKISPSILAKKIYKITLKKRPKYIYKIHQNLGLFLLSILPKRLQCFIVKLLLNRK